MPTHLPTHLPNRPRAKAIHPDDARGHDHRPRRNRPRHPVETIDWLALWALSLAFSAVVLAALAFFGGHDASGAAVILFGAASIIGLVLRFTKAPDDSR